MHAPEPTHEQEVHDQAEFDENVARDGKLVLGWLGGIGVVAALVMSIVAVAQSGQAHTVTVTNGMMASALPAGAATTAIASLPTRTISLKIIPESKPGLDGAKHDYLTQTEFAVKVGQKLELKIDNTDEGEHSITSPQIGVNIVIKPGVHIYELVVKENGRFSWFCVIPCDSNANGWAMQHAGFMSGYITAT